MERTDKPRPHRNTRRQANNKAADDENIKEANASVAVDIAVLATEITVKVAAIMEYTFLKFSDKLDTIAAKLE